jgi:hypothetical protein
MGLLDRLRARRGDDASSVAEPPFDRAARREQLDELEDALRLLARAMAEVPGRMENPGWRGRVEDYQWAAMEAYQMSQRDFGRADVLDLINQIRPLYSPNAVAPPVEYLPFEAQQNRLLAAIQVLRLSLPSESPESAQNSAPNEAENEAKNKAENEE